MAPKPASNPPMQSSSSINPEPNSTKPIHLVILIHGLFGSPANMIAVAEELYAQHGESSASVEASATDGSDEYREISPSAKCRKDGKDRKDELVVYSCNSFGWGHTWDGIDINAQRAAKEVDDEIRRLEVDQARTVGSISILGYSLGGLIARYLVGILSSRSPNFFEKHKAAAFVTMATPHIGTLRYGTTTNKIIHTIGRRLFSRTGRQLYCDDRDEEGRCLLEIMADPDGIFVHALQGFNKVLIVANGCHDLTVPFPTASISLSDPYQDYAAGLSPLNIEVNEKNIVTSHKAIRPIQDRGREIVKETNDGDITVTVTTSTNTSPKEEKVKLVPRPWFPMFFYLRWPFTYALFFLLPFIFPLWLCFVVGFTTLQSYRSSKRHQLLTAKGEHTPLLSAPILSSRHQPKSRRISGSTPDQESTGTATPPFEVLSPSNSVVPLYLTQRQEGMVRNLNNSLVGIERIVAWFPFAFNSHATLIMRDYKKFPAQEAARGVVSEVAGRILDAA